MEAINQRFNSDLKATMKAGDKRRVDTGSAMVNAALKDEDIVNRGQGKSVSQ